MFNMGLFFSCSKLQENEKNLVCNSNSDKHFYSIEYDE